MQLLQCRTLWGGGECGPLFGWVDPPGGRQFGRLRAYLRGWKAYLRLAQIPRIFRELDERMCHLALNRVLPIA